jgi:hypothetical protein
MAPSLFTAVEPREDVREGTLSEAIFAASLDDVVNAPPPPSTVSQRPREDRLDSRRAG